MTARDDLDRQLDSFLRDGPTELPEPSFYAVRHRTESTRQRVVIGPWRMPDPMNRFAAIGLGTAAVVVALVVGIQILRPSAPGGVGGASSAAPSPTPAPTTASPSTSAASPPTLTQSFTSTMNGFSVSFPAGWIARAATRLRVFRAPVETAGWKAAPMDCLFQNARDLLRERSMFGSRPATK